MIHRGMILVCMAGAGLCGCHVVPARPAPPTDGSVAANAGTASASDVSPAAAHESKAPGGEVAASDAADATSSSLPPCLPADPRAKPAQKHRSRSAQHSSPAPSAEPLPPAPPASPSNATIEPIAVSSTSILGKQVQGLAGEDLGRVVDLLADTTGHVRIAIIEAGGFLGLGNRRIAVDWSLLKFHPEDPQGTVTLNVTKRRLQGAPEYKDSAHPLALMAPAAAVPVVVPVPEGKK